MKARVGLLLLVASAGCSKTSIDQGGVQAVVAAPQVLRLTRGNLEVVYRGAEGAQAGGRLELRQGALRGTPVQLELRVDGDELVGIDRQVAVDSGVAVVRERLRGKTELTVSALPDGAELRVRAPKGRRVVLALRIARSFDVVLDKGAPLPPGPIIAETMTGYAAIEGSEGQLVVTGRPAIAVAAGQVSIAPSNPKNAGQLVMTTGVDGDRPVDFVVTLSLAADLRAALARGAALSGVPARAFASVSVEPRDASTRAFLPARLYAEAPPGAPASILDPTREAQPTMPIVDLTKPRMVLSLTPGRWVLRATRGPGYGVARRVVDVLAGDALRVPLDLVEEGGHRESTMPCDLHVHARPSWDAVEVSYHDRVRSLAAVGVECAAATEHDVVGDHGPAAHDLGLDLTAMKGVELTTLAPSFGHFNVYPWPDGAAVPKTKATVPNEIFDAMHALPGDHVIQVNHPRMSSHGNTIGYFEAEGVDPKTGKTPAKGFRRDYDAIEVFNGMDLDRLDIVHGLLEEWLAMLDRGEVHVATGSSDSHKLTVPWAGFPRTMVEVGPAFRPLRPVSELVAALKAGRAWVTSGPIVDVRVGDATLGGVTRGGTARVVVRPSSWLGAPRIRVRLGSEVLLDRTPTLDPVVGFVVEVPLPKVTARRPLITTVEAEVVADGVGLFGFRKALAFTNPIWVVP